MDTPNGGQHTELKQYEPRPLSAEQIKFEEFTAQEEAHLRDYLVVILRRKWVIILFFIAVVLTVTISSFLMKPLYKATAVIRIDKDVPNVYTFKDVEGAANLDEEYYETQYKVLKSRALARMTIDRIGLYNNPVFNPRAKKKGESLFSPLGNALAGLMPFLTGKDPEAEKPDLRPSEDEYQHLLDRFIGMLDVMPVKQSQLVDVSFVSPSPSLAQQTVNSLAQAYIDFNMDTRLNASRQAKAVLEKQLDVLKAKVETSEAALNNYAEKNGMLIVDDKDNKQNILIQKLSTISGDLTTSTADRIKSQALENELRRSQDNPVVMENSLVLGLKKEYDELESQYYNDLKIYKPDFPRMQRLKSQMDALQNRIAKEQKNIVRSVDSEYKTDLTKEKYLAQEYERQERGILDYQKNNTQFQILKRDADDNRQLYDSLLQRLKEVSVSATKTSTNIQILDEADLPEMPFKPDKPKNILLAMIFGLAGGVGLAFFMEYFDNTFKNTHEIEKSIRLPALGMIPMQKLTGSVKRPLIAYSKSRSPVAEAFRSIGTFILLSSSSKPPKTILVTSPNEKEGKTTISINTAMALAETMTNGIIIDADLRKPKLHHSFEVDNDIGLSTFLSGNMDFEEGLIKKTRMNGLSIITSGPIPPNPSELIVSKRMKELLEALYMIYDFVIIDSAPVMGMPDSIFLSSIVDGSVIVVKAGETTRQILAETKKIYRNINAKILGVVLNGIKESDLRYNYYSNYYSSYFKEGQGGNE